MAAEQHEALIQDSLDFFNDVFTLVPETHRWIPKDLDNDTPKKKTKK
jgi:hypothetical protein